MSSIPVRHTKPAPALARVLKLLAPLKEAPDGQSLYAHIERRLQAFTSEQMVARHLHVEIISLLLDALADRPESGAARLLKLSLSTELTHSELSLLRDEVRCLVVAAGGGAGRESGYRGVAKATGVKAAEDEFIDLTGVDADRVSPEAQAMQSFFDEAGNPDFSVPTYAAGAQSDVSMRDLEPSFQKHLESTRANMVSIHAQLGEQISDTIKLNDEIAAMLQGAVGVVCQVEPVDGDTSLRREYINQCNELIRRQQDMTTRFDRVRNRLNEVLCNNEELSEELNSIYRMSLTDELTTLLNRRALFKHLEDEMMRSQRYGTPMSFALIDIDHFKQVNDNYGHDVGDAVLKHYATQVFTTFRHHDTIARYGGEEFAVLFPNTDLNGALRALHKVQYRVGEALCRAGDVSLPLPTFSAGVAMYIPGESDEDLIKRADTALYQAKEKGRNRIELSRGAEEQVSQAS